MKHKHSQVKQEKINTVNWLVEQFPAAFFDRPHLVKPLKIGIFEDIIEFYERLESPPFSKKTLRAGLTYYSHSPAYLKKQQSGAMRIDLFGNEVEPVTQEQADYAQLKASQRTSAPSTLNLRGTGLLKNH